MQATRARKAHGGLGAAWDGGRAAGRVRDRADEPSSALAVAGHLVPLREAQPRDSPHPTVRIRSAPRAPIQVTSTGEDTRGHVAVGGAATGGARADRARVHARRARHARAWPARRTARATRLSGDTRSAGVRAP